MKDMKRMKDMKWIACLSRGRTSRDRILPFMIFTVFMTFMPAQQAQDWPQFRGPTGQGHSTETGLPLE
ncbi:MAG TPA: hypothetical protein VF424_02505 [Vicinamibacterales bacterium]